MSTEKEKGGTQSIGSLRPHPVSIFQRKKNNINICKQTEQRGFMHAFGLDKTFVLPCNRGLTWKVKIGLILSIGQSYRFVWLNQKTILPWETKWAIHFRSSTIETNYSICVRVDWLLGRVVSRCWSGQQSSSSSWRHCLACWIDRGVGNPLPRRLCCLDTKNQSSTVGPFHLSSLAPLLLPIITLVGQSGSVRSSTSQTLTLFNLIRHQPTNHHSNDARAWPKDLEIEWKGEWKSYVQR